MSKIPETVWAAWEEKAGPVVLTTVNGKGIPNAIYATCTARYGDDCLIVADNYFSKTRENLLAGGRGSLLFITKDNKAFQAKGNLEYHKEGKIFDEMKTWNPKEHPGHGAAVLRIEEIFSGAEKVC